MKDNKSDALRRSLTAIKSLKEQLSLANSATREPVAITGAACRLPGEATSLGSYWELLENGRDAIVEVPPERWDINAYYGDNPEEEGKMYTRWGGFLSEPVDEFDAEFFGISDREADSLDPQQRYLLRMCWEALENSGTPPDSLRGGLTGVFVGISTFDYKQLLIRADNREAFDSYYGTGSAASAAAGRISHQFGLQGPCLPVDTACSSSLLAAHLAAHSLRRRECDLALVGGVNLILDPWTTIYFCKMGVLSADGVCAAFDRKSVGYSRGEGCGVIVLKRLADALESDDDILAVIRGGAVNHDGPSAGLTIPNARARQKVIETALKNAEVDPNEIGYIEAHGTGTQLGDAMEMRAMARVFSNRPKDNPLYTGSVKNNIGHLEAASGIAGLIKAALILKKGVAPPHINFKTLNRNITAEKWPCVIPTQKTKPAKEIKMAGVSAFGISGTNLHIILEKPPTKSRDKNSRPDNSLRVLPMSARKPEALIELMDSYLRYFQKNRDINIDDVQRVLTLGRSRFSCRSTIVARSLEEAVSKLKSKKESPIIHSSDPVVSLILIELNFDETLSVLENWRTIPAFRKSLEECELALKNQAETTLGQLLDKSDEKSRRALSFIAMFALGKTWLRWGVSPISAGGTGVGELVSCALGETLSLGDALNRLISDRSQAPEFSLPRMSIFSIANGEYIDWNTSYEQDYFERAYAKKPKFDLLREAMLKNNVNIFLALGSPSDEFAKIFRGENNRKSGGTSLKYSSLDKELASETLADLYESGIDINWEEVIDAKKGKPISMPNYPFQNRKFWNPHIAETRAGFSERPHRDERTESDSEEAEKLISKYLHGLVSNVLKVPEKNLKKALKTQKNRRPSRPSQ